MVVQFYFVEYLFIVKILSDVLVLLRVTDMGEGKVIQNPEKPETARSRKTEENELLGLVHFD